MLHWFSPLLIAIGQVLAIVLFFLYDNPRAFARKPRRIGLTAAFFLIHTAVQTFFHNYVIYFGPGSLPAFSYILATLLYYSIFVRLWSDLPPADCGFLALIFLLADNCIWPFLSSLSRNIWGISYLYEGRRLLRLPFILLFWGLESGLLILLRRLLPSLYKIRLDRYNITLTLTSLIPFLYIRVFSSRSLTQDNKTLQIAMTVCCLVALIALVSGVNQTASKYEELHAAQMKYVLQRQQERFQQKFSDIDAVNRKYHDMKNILLYLQASGGTEEIQEQIRHLLGEIRPYETSILTGNEAIDILLSEKLALCQQKQISCTPYLDGSLFDFVEPLDLCTLFGNAMDNAIESCSRIPEPADRQISIKSTQKGDTRILTFRNTFAERPEIRKGLPKTTKEDKKNHGYGLGNIQYIMKKYQGTMNCRIENQEFLLTLLFFTGPS